MTDYLYRYDVLTFEDSSKLFLEKFIITKHTPCGARIYIHGNNPQVTKFVNLNAKKQWACKTPEEAFISFQARKVRQIQILTAQLIRAKQALRLAPEKPDAPIELQLSNFWSNQ